MTAIERIQKEVDKLDVRLEKCENTKPFDIMKFESLLQLRRKLLNQMESTKHIHFVNY